MAEGIVIDFNDNIDAPEGIIENTDDGDIIHLQKTFHKERMLISQ